MKRNPCKKVHKFNLTNLYKLATTSCQTTFYILCRAQPRRRFGRKSLPKLADFSYFEQREKLKCKRRYREIQFLDQNFSLKLSQNFSLSESSRLTPAMTQILPFPCTRAIEIRTDRQTVTTDYFKCYCTPGMGGQ